MRGPLMCFGGASGTWGQALTTTAVDPSSSQPLMSFLARRVPFLLGDSPCPRQVTSTNSSEAKCALSPLAWGFHVTWSMCRCDICQLWAEAVGVVCVIWLGFFPDGKFRLLMLWCQSEKCNVDLQPGTGFDSTLTFYLHVNSVQLVIDIWLCYYQQRLTLHHEI